MAVTITIKGVKELNYKFSQLKDQIQKKALKQGINNATALVNSTAKYLVPKITSTLANSIHANPAQVIEDKIVGSVGTSMDYAIYVEYGTGKRGISSKHPKANADYYQSDWKGQPAQPYLYPALMNNKGKIQKLIITEIQRVIRSK